MHEDIVFDALMLWAKIGGSWISVRPAIANALVKKYGERAVSRALRRIGKLVDIYGDSIAYIIDALNDEEAGRRSDGYKCNELTVIRALVPDAPGYRFGSRSTRKARSLEGVPLLLGFRLCPPPSLDILAQYRVRDDVMPGAYELFLSCSSGRAVAHVFASGAVTIAVSDWRCAFEAYDQLIKLARPSGHSSWNSNP